MRPGRKSLGGGRSTMLSERAALDNAQVTALYSQCIQLSTANKITMQNTWQLKLIDYIDDVLKADDALGEDAETNFQKASCTLDASVKIYSYRVDSVHQNTYKILGGLSRSGADEDGELGDEEEEGEDLGAVVRKDDAKGKKVCAVFVCMCVPPPTRKEKEKINPYSSRCDLSPGQAQRRRDNRGQCCQFELQDAGRRISGRSAVPQDVGRVRRGGRARHAAQQSIRDWQVQPRV